MTGRTVLVARIGEIMRGGLRYDSCVGSAKRAGAIVAFQANRHDGGTAQQFLVHRAMRIVAGFASLDADGGMFENKRPALIGMAFEARLLIGQCVIDHARPDSRPPGWRRGSVRIVAIRTLDETFIYPML